MKWRKKPLQISDAKWRKTKKEPEHEVKRRLTKKRSVSGEVPQNKDATMLNTESTSDDDEPERVKVKSVLSDAVKTRAGHRAGFSKGKCHKPAKHSSVLLLTPENNATLSQLQNRQPQTVLSQIPPQFRTRGSSVGPQDVR